MSLLNDALLDLDRSGRTPPVYDEKTLSAAQSNGSFAKYRLPLIAVLVVLLWLVVEVDILGLMPRPSTTNGFAAPSLAAGMGPVSSASLPEVAVAQAQQAKPQAELTIGRKPVSAEEVAEPVATAVVPPKPPAVTAVLPKQAEPIAKLLDEAERAVQQDRLMSPPGNNAYHLYRSVLLVEPRNPQALAGIETILERYLTLTRQALDEHNTTAAKLYLQRAQIAGAQPRQLEGFHALMAEAQTAKAAANQVVSDQAALSSDKATSSDVKAVSLNTNTISFDKDADLAQRLRAHPTQYEHKAWQRLKDEHPSHATAMALADVYAAGNNLAQLEKLKQALAENASRAQQYVQAQWLIAQGDLRAAAQALSAGSTVQQENVFYLRLLAGVHAALGDYTQALPIYQQLLQVPEFHLNDWLGFALALERVGEQRGALQAYQKLSGIGHSDPRINEYVQARIRDLVGDLSGR